MPDNFSFFASTKSRLLKRSCESLIGICAGIMADDVLNDEEIFFLNMWLEDNKNIANTWPAEIIYRRIKDILADGKITEDERNFLKQTLIDLLGGSLRKTGITSGLSTNLSIDKVDYIEFENNCFCFTGTFLYGTRVVCEKAVLQRQGKVSPRVTLDLNYLVIGTLITNEWAHTSFGRKIEKAVEYKKRRPDILIISESQWVNSL